MIGIMLHDMIILYGLVNKQLFERYELILYPGVIFQNNSLGRKINSNELTQTDGKHIEHQAT